MAPKEKISSLLNLNSFQALEFISNTIEKALEAKNKSKEDSLYEEFLNDESYQKEMQKLENEIRNHIKIEQQMKLYSDALEEKHEKLAARLNEAKKVAAGKVEVIKQENKQIKAKILTIQKEIAESKKEEKGFPRVSSKTRLTNYPKNQEIDKKIAKIDHEQSIASKLLQDAEKEYSSQKKDNEELKIILKEFVALSAENQKERAAIYKKKFEEKCLEVESLKKKMKAETKSGRSVTPTLTKTIQMQSQKIIKKTGSNEKLKTMRFERLVTQPEKKRLPLSFTARK
jgi:hypothetical protein